MANSALWSEGSSTFDEQPTDGGGTGSDYTAPAATPRQDFTVKGFGLSATKIGKIADIHSQIVADGDSEEYWPHAVNGENIPNWPATKYPVVLYSSSDHSKGEGGIQVRVFNAELGGITDPNAWEEWHNVSNRDEFSHIVQKSSPIYYDTGSNQTETPTIVFKDGLVYMFYHTNSSPGVMYTTTVQNTHLAVSNNGIDFTLDTRSVLTYNPRYDVGKGHSGYANVAMNPMGLYDFDYISNSAHGGPRAFWGSDDLKNWVELELTGRTEGDFTPYAPEGTKWWLEPQTVASLRKDGAYWRMVYNFRRNSYKGGDDAPIFPVEFLLDERFNIVSAPNFFTQLGGSGEFDQAEMMHYSELEYNGKRYAFYKGADSSNVTSIGMLELTESVIDWTIIRPHSERSVLQRHEPDNYSGLTAIGNTTLSSVVRESSNHVNFTVPSDGSLVGVKSSTVVLDDYDVIDILVRKNSKIDTNDISGLVGLFDDPLNIQEALSLRWPEIADGIDELTLDKYSSGALTRESLEFEIGIADGNGLNQGAEDPRAPATLGLRIIPSERVLFVLNGATPTSKHTLDNVNTSIPLTPALLFQSHDGLQGNVDFEAIEVIVYSSEAIAVPQAPTVATSKTNDSVTITASNVSGATGYKYFLDNQQNETGVFTDLEPDTTYTVYARASNALGDSAPSTIQTVTTDSAVVPNQAPTANAGANQSVAAGVNVVLDGSNSADGDGAIVNYLWEQVSGPSVTINNADQSTASFISPSEASQQVLSFRLTVTDNDGDSSSVTTTVTVAAVPDVADPLDETLSFINIKSRVGIEDDRQALEVVSLYQYSDNFILCEIVNKGGSTLEPALFSKAEYRLTDQKGNDVAKLDLSGGIKAVGNKFFIHVNSGILNNSHKGSLRHQFVVWNQAGYKLPPIFSGSINIIPVLEPTA
jgi:hypothetical protein